MSPFSIVVMVLTVAGMMITGFIPWYIVGVLVCGVLCAASRTWPRFCKITVRSCALAMLLAPGVIIGHGFAFAPAFYVVIVYIFDWPSNIDPSLAWSGGVWPFTVTWVILAAVLSLIHPKQRQLATAGSGSAESTKGADTIL